MKRKIVLWGQNENEKKLLIALELMTKENSVNVYTFNEEIATEEFYNQMMDEWRIDKEVVFPEGHETIVRELSITEDLLPESIKVQRTDLINRAKAEWHFAVLSSKLYELYKSELEELKDRIEKLTSHEDGLWEEMKGFWSKVQKQMFEKNLFREHADKLKEETNRLFSELKELRSKANEELEKVSKQRYEAFSSRLDEIAEKVDKGLGLSPIFEELKKIQSEFRKEVFTRSDQSKLWKRIDESFKTVKEKKYGKRATDSGNMSRLDRRYQGLIDAIAKMDASISRDKKDISFQSKRAEESDGQLEMQIRQAKVKMVEERINSKIEKLNEMLVTKTELDQKIEKEKLKENKLEKKKEIEKLKSTVKEKIASEIKEKKESLSEEEEKLKEAAEALNEMKHKKAKPKKETLMAAITATVGEAVEDMVDTVKAVSQVVGEKVEEKVEDLKENVEFKDTMDKVKDAIAEVKEKVSEKVEEVKEAFDQEDKNEETEAPEEIVKDKPTDSNDVIGDEEE